MPSENIVKYEKKTKENDIESYLGEKSKENDFLYYKFKSPANSGVPDRIMIGHGMTIFVELKKPGEKPRKLQERVISRMKEHGASVYVIDTKEKVDGLFDEILYSDKQKKL
jgi:hypothetical protein